jgi:hypothetical protein
VETTPSPPSGANDVTQPPSFEAVIDTTDVSVFGKHFYDVIDLADFTDEVSAALGSTTWDTGWQLMPAEYSCTLNSAYRTMWWGDVRLTFETGAESPDTYFTAWSVGDPSVSFLAPLGPLASTTEPASGLKTRQGIGIGTALDELKTALTGHWYIVSDGRVDIPGVISTSFLLDDDSRVTAIGSGRMDCIDEAKV